MHNSLNKAILKLTDTLFTITWNKLYNCNLDKFNPINFNQEYQELTVNYANLRDSCHVFLHVMRHTDRTKEYVA